MRGRLLPACAVGLVVFGVAHCGGDDDESVSAKEAPSEDSIDWHSCDEGEGQCADVEVPVDYGNSHGQTIELSVRRLPATGDRVGPLFVNPGGPGGTASDYVAKAAEGYPEAITERFDIVGMDPRGLGSSEIDCGSSVREKAQQVDYSIDSDDDKQTLIDLNQQYVDGCEQAVGAALAHFGARDVARDMDTVRAKMGDETISYLGYSWGTVLGQVYADQFPDRVRAMVLDGVPSLGDGLAFARTQAQGFESALGEFVNACNSTPACLLQPDALGAIDQLRAQVETAPVPAEPRPLGPAELSQVLAQSLYSQDAWSGLAKGIADARNGDGTTLMELTEGADEGFDVYNAVFCTDWSWPATTDEILAAGTDTRAVAPRFGEATVNDYARCALWPREGTTPLTPGTAPATPQMLVIGTTHDPATPYQGTVDTAQRLNAALLTFEGEGHGIAGKGVPCIDDALVAYLLDLTTPSPGTTCQTPQDPTPADSTP